MSSGEKDWPSAEMRAPVESERETTVPPSSMTLSAANWATLPDPEMATVLPLNVP